ncbi:YrdB family protein [Lactobacillus sp. ESL0731]|uniref:YrdB family protein n=1 Tax=unclassified Lactobacillus TaxID=2620435 RepID=UPI0023F70ECB|nr:MULTISPECIES: YrdB family protein [unclassified Lactobacillus]WEV50775.1 YrdB family protein [Lactobacillus sp. ESL0700]WEV61906.1 YrdB family protein [Lactobacillus sp. ESL0731]
MNFIKIITLSCRFLLECATVIGIFSGAFIKRDLLSKIIFAAVAILIFLVWSRYGAPHSPQALTGVAKLILEVLVYTIGSSCWIIIFGKNIGSIYSIIAIFDLILMYLLQIEQL